PLRGENSFEGSNPSPSACCKPAQRAGFCLSSPCSPPSVWTASPSTCRPPYGSDNKPSVAYAPAQDKRLARTVQLSVKAQGSVRACTFWSPICIRSLPLRPFQIQQLPWIPPAREWGCQACCDLLPSGPIMLSRREAWWRPETEPRLPPQASRRTAG